MGGGPGYYVGGSSNLDLLRKYQAADRTPPEELLAKLFREDLGVEINPMALRMFIRLRWDRAQVLAHAIHDGK
jgi:hypothetical protein